MAADPYMPKGDNVAPTGPQILRTPLTDLLKIRHPVLLAGMNTVASAPLAAAVSNAGGLGNIGGVGYTPAQLRKEIAKLKAELVDKTAFGIDLLLPQVGGSARKTNTDYTGGKLPELIDIIIESKARLFISAVGVPPRWAVDKLHAAGILCMNMCGHPHHVDKALDVGCDLICVQGTEGGGHTGEIGTMTLLPQCVDKCRGKKSALNGGPVYVVAAGGIYDSRGLAASLSLGAQGVWIGTRFVASKEATTTKMHKDGCIKAGPTDSVRTLIYTGRPLRVIKTDYVKDWENNRQEEITKLTSQGKLPAMVDGQQKKERGEKFSIAKMMPLLIGQCSGAINKILPAKEIIDEMVHGAAQILRERVQTTVVAKL